MRVHLRGDHRRGVFAKMLLDIGEDRLNDQNNVLDIPAELYTLVDTVGSLIDHISLTFNTLIKNHNLGYVKEFYCPPPSPTNSSASKLNSLLLQSIDGVEVKYKTIDLVPNSNEEVNYTIKFLNTLKLFSMRKATSSTHSESWCFSNPSQKLKSTKALMDRSFICTMEQGFRLSLWNQTSLWLQF